MPEKPTFENFDPNQPDKSDVWGVYDNSVFKTKSARPAALNALKACHRGKLYELVSGTWVLRAVKDPLDIAHGHCDTCGANLVETETRHTYKGGRWVSEPGDLVVKGYWDWRRESGKIVSPIEMLRFCTICYRGYS